jgi:hypothetical protein
MDQTNNIFEKHSVRTFGKFEGFLVRILGKTIDLPSGNRIKWWRGMAYVWERRVYHCGGTHHKIG